ncbi:MAG: putative Ig domain-containing protein [Cyanobacteria bacterium P01_D01_bin.50]
MNPFGLDDVGGNASPTFADIDDDRDLDAFVGNRAGNTLFFENEGTASNPSFASRIANPFGLGDVGGRAAPTFADIDDDGDLDAFVGNGAGNTLFFENEGTASNPSFAGPITNPFGLRDTGNFANPIFVDIDGDGDLDAFDDDSSGRILFFENEGTASNPSFAASIRNPFGLGGVGGFANPTFADIDGDGDLDAFDDNSSSRILFFENEGTASNPSFAASIRNPFGLGDVGEFANPTFADIDGDGGLDAFVGNGAGNTVFFENNPLTNQPPTGDITDQTVDAYSIFKLESSDFITDADGDALTYSANLAGGDPLPSWLNIDPNTGKLSGLPTASDEGNLTIEVTADDGNGGVFTDSFDLAIELPLNSTTNTINGDSNDNKLPGTNANDNINGKAGNDDINAKQGDDNLFGNAGNDDINGMPGNDYIDGGSGNDLLNGEKDNDILVGGFGDDILRGGNGNDTVDGGNGADEVRGGSGDDVIIGGKGLDTLVGSNGEDQFVLTAGEGRDTIRDYVDGKDSLLLTGGLSFGSLNITDSGTGDTIISAEGSGVLAILEGVNSSLIEASDFTTIH